MNVSNWCSASVYQDDLSLSLHPYLYSNSYKLYCAAQVAIFYVKNISETILRHILRIYYAKTEDRNSHINHSIKAFNPFLRTSPATVPAKCFPKCRKRTHSKGIYKSSGQDLIKHGLKDSKLPPFHLFF